MNPLRKAAAVLLLLHLAGCDSSGPAPPPTFVLTGLVEFVQVEGGCFVFHGDDGTDYNLFAEPSVGLEDVLEDGAFLEIEVRIRQDVAGFCPGRIVEVVRILSVSLPLFVDDLWLLVEKRDDFAEWRIQGRR